MIASICLRVFLAITGVVVFGVATVSLANKHMTESFCLFWGLVSVLFVASGIFLRPSDWNRYISWFALIIVFIGVVCLLIAGFYFSVRISRLMRQMTELSIQVSLLNQENEMLLKIISEHDGNTEITDTEIHGHEEKNTVYN